MNTLITLSIAEFYAELKIDAQITNSNKFFYLLEKQMMLLNLFNFFSI